MEAIEREVRKVMLVEMVTIIKEPINPTFPTTQPKRRYMITPRIVRMDGVNTPSNVLNPSDLPLVSVFSAACFNYKILPVKLKKNPVIIMDYAQNEINFRYR